MGNSQKKSIAFTNLDWSIRKAIMGDLELAGSEMYQGHTGNGFIAAIGREALSTTHEAMAKHGFVPKTTVTFPLGTDQPAQHLRHDHNDIKSCQWLLCTYVPEIVTGDTVSIQHPWVIVTNAGTDLQRIDSDYPTFGSALIGLKELDAQASTADIMKRQEDGTLTTEF